MLDQLIDHWKEVHTDLLATIDKFSEAELDYAPYDGGMPAREIMLHIAHEEMGEFRYGIIQELDQWPAAYHPKDYPSKESIKALLTEVHEEIEIYLKMLERQSMNKIVETPWGASIQLGRMTLHILEHTIHHRGELSLILGILGHQGLDA